MRLKIPGNTEALVDLDPSHDVGLDRVGKFVSLRRPFNYFSFSLAFLISATSRAAPEGRDKALRQRGEGRGPKVRGAWPQKPRKYGEEMLFEGHTLLCTSSCSIPAMLPGFKLCRFVQSGVVQAEESKEGGGGSKGGWQVKGVPNAGPRRIQAARDVRRLIPGLC